MKLFGHPIHLMLIVFALGLLAASVVFGGIALAADAVNTSPPDVLWPHCPRSGAPKLGREWKTSPGPCTLGREVRPMWPARLARSLPLRLLRTEQTELMDHDGHDPAVLAQNFRDLRRVNRWLGGAALTMQGLARVTRGMPPGGSLTVLDVATGCADIPEAIVTQARRRGLRVRLVATDASPAILGLAPRGVAEIELALADARRLPFADGSFDVVTCSLVLHHLPPAEAVAMLREMRRVARRGVVVNDMVRSWHGLLGAWALSRAATRNPLTRNDAPLSVRRSYTRAEMAALAAEAGLEHVAFIGFLGYRVTMAAGGPS